MIPLIKIRFIYIKRHYFKSIFNYFLGGLLMIFLTFLLINSPTKFFGTIRQFPYQYNDTIFPYNLNINTSLKIGIITDNKTIKPTNQTSTGLPICIQRVFPKIIIVKFYFVQKF